MSERVVREASLADVEALAAMHAAVFGLDLERARVDMREELGRPWARILVIEEESPTAYAVFWFVADEVSLLHVAVRPDRRRTGAGARLLREGMQLGRTRGATTFLLEVRAGNTAAIALYLHLGMAEITRRSGYYPDGEDALVFQMGL